MNIRGFYILLGVIIIFLVMNSFYIVDQRQQAVVVQFGEAVKVVEEPGLKVKLPLIQSVLFFDNRILDLNADPREVIAADEKRLIVDAFARYKIIDPLKFYQTVRDEAGVRNRLNSILDSSLRQVLGSVPLSTLLTGQRPEIMKNITEIVNNQAQNWGVTVLDVRIMRADLPQKNSEAIYLRMQTERDREAKQFRAQGAEEALAIRAKADRDRVILLAEAQKKAQILRGQGDSEAAGIFAEAFSKDPDFASFYRTMQVYRQTMKKDDTTVILSPNGEFMRYFQ